MSSRVNPQVIANADKMKDLNRPIELHTEFDMMKFLDNYKKSVDYYNSYGLNNAPNSTQASRQASRRVSTSSTFWDLN